MIGQSFGRYQIVEQIGAGGMGIVYRATDTLLDRGAALKLLPETFVHDAERMSRFRREARLLASLNHPNIAIVYGLEDSGDACAIAMELVEGQSLAERLLKGPIPLEETLAIARQIAEALEAAHEKGIIHRDLKPANVKVAADGKVKVLDFGLAKALDEDAAAVDPTASPTISEMATRGGVILGTAGYMSPEQARGRLLDRRTDVWSFGCLLYEMLTGRMVFQAGTIPDTLVQVLEREPDWQALPVHTPANVRHTLARCLRKDPARRLRDIADARMELDEPSANEATFTAVSSPEPSTRPVWSHPLGIGLVAMVLLLAVALVWSLVRTPELPGTNATVSRLSVVLPAGRQLVASPHAIAISPDGSELVLWVEEDRGRPGPIDDVLQLYRRPLADLSVLPISGTEMGGSPFFSPDGEWLGFSGPDGLMKLSMRGGAPITIQGTAAGALAGTSLTQKGATWMNDDHLVFATDRELLRLAADGGQPDVLLNWGQLEKGEVFISYPNALTGTSAFLLNLITADPTQSTIAVWSDGAAHRILRGGLNPMYLPTGHLLYLRQPKSGAIRYDAYAVPFDLSTLEISGKELPVLEDIRYGQLAVSATGTLAYNSSGAEEMTRQLTWVDRNGATEPIADKQVGQSYLSPRISPDGTRLLYALGRDNADCHLYVRDLASGASHVVGGTSTWWAVWTPDGSRVAYIHMAPESTVGNLFWQAADGTGPEERLTKSDRHQQPLFVTPDGGTLVFHEESPDTGYDLWQLSLHGDHTPKPLLQTKAGERLASLAQNHPDYMAYVSDRTGRDEIWVSPFPGCEGAQQVTVEGGTAPLWSRDGLTLFYRNAAATRLFARHVTWNPNPTFGPPEVVNGWWVKDHPWGRQYDVTPDGKSFVMIAGTSTAGNQITVVLNWFEELKRKLQGRIRF